LQHKQDERNAEPAGGGDAAKRPASPAALGLSNTSMPTNFFYLYAIKDPRCSLARPFYIGKGTGSRTFDHWVSPDSTRKYKRIKEIVDAAHKPLIYILVEDLTEAQALRLEFELIAAFGTEEIGGLLTNTVVPSGLGWADENYPKQAIF